MTLLSWNIFNTKFIDCFDIEFISVDNILGVFDKVEIIVDWHPLNNWEDLDDLELLGELKKLHEINNDFFIVTEASYKKKNGPFYLQADELDSFVSNHLKNYGECFVNGDVAIISFKTKSIWLFHHEGMYAYINLE